MKLHEIRIPKGARKKPKRVGRGESSGYGRTAGKGNKGQNARSGGGKGGGFEGGQMPLKRRLPKRGFTNPFKKNFTLVNVGDLDKKFPENTVVDPALLVKEKLIKKLGDGLKVLGKGEITKPLVVKTHRISKQAREKIEQVGGKVEVL
jgi:large subunit ribosomal protein L15